MLKKRILASSLASVMALSSVSVVAFADETATSDIKTEAVTKAQLKEYVKSLEKFAEDELSDYGTTLGEYFTAAYDAAKVVINDGDASADDVNAAYQMLKAVKGKLVMHTTEELADLVEDNQKIYDTENILNKEFNDEIYKGDTWAKFAAAFDTAKDSLEETDPRVINDAYADLEAAINGLKNNDVVTKSQFRSTYTDYINLVNEFDKNEEWRRGKVTVGANKVAFGKAATGNNAEAGEETVCNLKDALLTFEEIKDVVYGASNKIPGSLAEDKGANVANVVTDNDDTKLTWIDFGGEPDVDTGLVAPTTLAEDAKNAYDKFITNSNSNKTTLVTINTTYKSMKKAIEVFNGWIVDGNKSGSRTSINTLLKNNHAALVSALIKEDNDAYNAHVAKIETGLGLTSGDIVVDTDKGTIKINADVAAGKSLLVDTNTGCVAVEADDYGTGSVRKIAVAKGTDITKYMPFNSDFAGTNLDDINPKTTTKTVIKFSDAYKAFDIVTEHEDNKTIKTKNYKKAFEDESETALLEAIDTRGLVTDSAAKSVVYPLIYRAFKYAIDDMFPGSTDYTKKQVSELITASNKLIEDTGDASIFKENNSALDDARKDAIAWVAAATAMKGYKDGSTVDVDAAIYTYDGFDGDDATTVYKALKDAYDDLNDQFTKLPVSFGDIAKAVSTAADGIDNGVFGASANDIAAAVADVAYDLSTLNYSENYEAYDDDRNYIFYNRLNTDGNDGEKALYTKYQALVKAMEEATKEPEKPDVVLGDVDGDKVANAKDALMIVQAAVGLVTLTDDQKAAADFNNDGKVTSDDALEIVKAALGLN